MARTKISLEDGVKAETLWYLPIFADFDMG